MSYGQDGDSGQVVLSGSNGATAEMGFLDAGPTLVEGLDVVAVGLAGAWVDDEGSAQVAECSAAKLGQVDLALPEEFAAPESARLVRPCVAMTSSRLLAKAARVRP